MKFNDLNANYSSVDKTEYLNSENLPQSLDFIPKQYTVNFETKLLHHKPNIEDITVKNPYTKPKKDKNKTNLDDTIDFIREDEEPFDFNNSMEYIQEIEKHKNTLKKASTNNTSLDTSSQNEQIYRPLFTNKVKLTKKPSNDEKLYIYEKPKLNAFEEYAQKLANELLEEKKQKFLEDCKTVALTKKELRNLIIKHGAGVKESIDQEKLELEQAEEIKRKEQMKAYYNAMQINKILWYYYIYFPEQYPMILAQYQQRLNQKLGVNAYPTSIPDFFQNISIPTNFADNLQNKPPTQNSYDKLPPILNGKYKPEFNQNNKNNKYKNLKVNTNGLDNVELNNRRRSNSYNSYKEIKKPDDSDKSLPNVNNRSSSNKKKNIYYNSSGLKPEESPNISRISSKNQQKVAERYGLTIFREDIRNITLKGVISLNVMDFFLQYYIEKTKYRGFDKQVKFYKINDFNEILMRNPIEAISDYEMKSTILFFPVIVSISKAVIGLLLIYPAYKKIVYYEPEGSSSSGFLESLVESIEYTGKIERMVGGKCGIYVLRMGYLLMNSRKDIEIEDKHLEGFKARIQQLLYEVGITNNQKGELGEFNFII